LDDDPRPPDPFQLFQEPTPADRARAVAGGTFGAFLLAQVYFTLDSLLYEVARWPFTAVRIVLFVGCVGGFAGILYIGFRHLHRLDAKAALWLFVATVGALLCWDVLYGM
jgi:H+/Cl- antiporter ClcA